MAATIHDEHARLRFCTLCGEATVDGRCAKHGADHPPAKARRRWRTPIAATAVAVLVVALIIELLVLRSDLNRERSHRVDATRQLQERVDADEATAKSTSDRIASLEARAAGEVDPAAIAQSVQPSVFTIETDSGLGSGFVVRSDASTSTLVTNFHVVADLWNTGGRDVKVKQEDLTFSGTVTTVDEAADLALISVGHAIPALRLQPVEPKVGDAVLVVGSPLGLGGSISSGIVSALRTEAGVRYLQFSAPISPGNSGGPVVDHNGSVVGISVSKFIGNGAEGLSFAIPAEQLCSSFQLC